jgi:cell division protein FtsN
LLKSKNLSASIIGKTNSGLIRVGIGNYATAEAASEDMKALKEQQIEVWVLKN